MEGSFSEEQPMKNTAPWVLILAAILAIFPFGRPKPEDRQAQAAENKKTEVPAEEVRGKDSAERDPRAEAKKDAAEQADGCEPEKGKTVPPQPWCEPLRVLHDF